MISKILDNHKLSLLSLALLITSTHNSANANGLTFPNNNILLNDAVYQQKVSGTVRSVDGPLAGATISVKGSSKSTSTDATGKFNIDAKNGDLLVVSSVGFKTQEIVVTGQVININLESNDEALEEVVVTGYSRQKKTEVSASVVSIDQKTLKDVKSPNVSNLLQSKIAGVDVVAGSGRPGANANIRVRGRNSINSNISPLWVVDGVIMHGTPNINPNDIESVSVLKDAAATTQYGSRGASGVIVVTTKRALKPGEHLFAVNLSSGISKFNPGKFKVMNSQQMWDLYQSFNNQNAIPNNITSDVLNTDFNWLANGTQNGAINDFSANYLGKTEETSIYASGNYYDEKGSVKGYDYNRLTGRLNIEHKLTKNLTFKPKLNASYTSYKDRQHSIYDMYLNMPWDTPFYADGSLKNTKLDNVGWYGRDNNNYLYDLQYNYGEGQTFDVQSNLDFSLRISDKFTFESMNSLTYYNQTTMSYTDPKSNSGLENKGSVSQFSDKRITRFFNQMLKYKENFGKHEVSALAAYEYSDYVYTSVGAAGKGISAGSTIVDNAANFLSQSGTKNDYAFQSGLVQVNYKYDERYNFQGSYRLDGASRFGANNRYGGFFAVSGAWNINKEDFFHVDMINLARLRASYGEVGNTPTSLYASYSLYGLNGQYNGEPAAIPNQYNNRNVSWEKSRDVNLGLELGLFNRIDVTVDVYNKNTDGLLSYVKFPATAGWDGYWYNIGSINNKGLELAINARVLDPESALQWNVGANWAANRNRVKQLKDGTDVPAGNKRYSEGRDIDSWYMRKWSGVDENNGAPLWEVVNAETGEISTTSNYNKATLQFVGTSTPKYQGGINTSFLYKGISLTATFSYLHGAYAYNGGRELFDSDGAYPSYNQMVLADGWSRWSPSNTNATHPVASYNNNSGSNKTSSRYLEDASFFRLRNVTLAYDFNPQLLKRLKLKSVNVFVAADNLWLSTKFTGVDPEAALFGDSTSQYPSPKRVTAGVNFTF
ncbi:SusC/RagA family TonB-linked outer membrane protein [Sphingobacterium siyangense]|uniref:SusC/RagA family TonB-linked outer membrane protein n=1 Tax=Sphingobacterium siyangense TaxID=459529 RepID=UPI002FD8D24C